MHNRSEIKENLPLSPRALEVLIQTDVRLLSVRAHQKAITQQLEHKLAQRTSRDPRCQHQAFCPVRLGYTLCRFPTTLLGMLLCGAFSTPHSSPLSIHEDLWSMLAPWAPGMGACLSFSTTQCFLLPRAFAPAILSASTILPPSSPSHLLLTFKILTRSGA